LAKAYPNKDLQILECSEKITGDKHSSLFCPNIGEKDNPILMS